MSGRSASPAGCLKAPTFVFAAEMAKVLDDRPNLRVLPIVTYGALGNVEDLLYLKGVDVTITSADVLDEFIRNGTISNIKNRIRYICSFYLNEVHVYVRPEIKTLEDLAGKKVSFNTVGSAANLTGGILFDRLHINAEKVFINNSVALEKMRTGEIAGVVHVTGQADRSFHEVQAGAGIPLPTGAVHAEFAGLLCPDRTYLKGLSQSSSAWRNRGHDRGAPSPSGV